MVHTLEIRYVGLLQGQAHSSGSGLDLVGTVPVPPVLALFGDFLVLGVPLLNLLGRVTYETVQPFATLSELFASHLDDLEPPLLIHRHAGISHLDTGEEC